MLVDALSEWLDQPGATRERRVMALAALAAIGRPVLADVRSLAAEDGLTVRERLYLGLAFAASGDDAAALAIEQGLLAEFGQRLGPWVRLKAGASMDDTLDATSLLALLAASLGDPIGADAQAYVEANPGHDDLFVLQQLGYVQRALERTTAEAGRFAATVAGELTVHDLRPGERWTVTLTAAQLATLRLEPLAGDLAVTTGWTAPFDPSTATADPDVTIKRTIIPSGTLPDDRLVRVSIRIHFGPQAPSQCHEVTDDLPSGLAPMTRTRSASDEESAGSARLPDLVEGQHVSWCVAPDAKHRDFRLAYSARVVSPGTYRWEPATVQLAVATERITATPPVTITIR